MSSNEAASRVDRKALGLPSWIWALFFVVLAASAIIAPMFFLGDASGHDFEFHVASWMEVAGQWRQGILYPRWAEWANWGYGEPRFIFYPPASWLMGAALGTVLPWPVVPSVYIWLTLVGGGTAMWRLGREWLSGGESIGAAVFFVLNPYNLILVYYRSDFAELLALALFPLLVLSVLRVGRNGWKSAVLLALIFAGVWLSNAPAAVIATYSVALLLATTSIVQRKWRPLRRGCAAMIWGFGLAAFYILPAAWEQRWVQIRQAVSDHLQVAQNFAFAHTTQPEFLFFNLKVSVVALETILITSISAVFLARRRRELAAVWWPLVVLGALATLMMFSPSGPFWRFLPELRFVQFPWRWQESLVVVFAFFAAAAWRGTRKRWAAWAVVGILLGSTGAALAASTWWEPDDVPSLADSMRSHLGYEGTDEYEPRGADRFDLYGVGFQAEEPPTNPIPLATEMDSVAEKIVPANGAQVNVETWTAEKRTIVEENDRPMNLALRLLAYPAWSLRVDGHPDRIEAAPAGQIVIRVPAGAHRIDLRFRRTWDRTLGDAISMLFAMALCFGPWLDGVIRFLRGGGGQTARAETRQP
jgi:6-pyruvoyl-tetrahydropterin synthase related domain